MSQFDFKRAEVLIKDGSGESITVVIGEGNLSWTEHKNREYKLDRGRLGTVRDGDEQPVDLRLDARWEFLKGDTGDPPTVEDAFKKRGGAVDWESTDDDECAPFAVDIEIQYTPLCEGTTPEKILFQDFRYETADHDAKAGTLSFSGKANITEPTVTRAAITS